MQGSGFLVSEKEIDVDIVNMLVNIDPKTLARCKKCNDPLYIILDQSLRDKCYHCDLAERIDRIA